jgi:hypothetical protein
MSNEHSRDRGKLFEHKEKLKPSQPAFHGDCTIDGTAYEIRGWHREEQLTLSLAPPRGDKNTFPPDVFRGALDPVPQKPAPSGKRGKDKGKDAAPAEPTPLWIGVIVSDEAAYQLRAFEKQGKSGPYFTLEFERVEKPTKEDAASSWESAEHDD